LHGSEKRKENTSFVSLQPIFPQSRLFLPLPALVQNASAFLQQRKQNENGKDKKTNQGKKKSKTQPKKKRIQKN